MKKQKHRLTSVMTGIVCPGGWHKPEKNSRGDLLPEPIRSSTYEDLIDAVIKFRVDNGIPVADAQGDIDEYICTSFPFMCHGVPGAEVSFAVKHIPHIVSLTDSMLQTMEKQLQNHSIENIELKSEAQRRANICRHCQFNVRWNSGCGSCVEAVNRLSGILRIGNSVDRSKDLRACSILKHENRSAIWLKLDKIGKSSDLPAHCWAK